MKKLGVGTYRLLYNNKTHEAAVLKALESGFSVIDTSPNYNDGLSEMLVGSVLKNPKCCSREKIELISKFGFIQGKTLETHSNTPIPGAVVYTPNCFHSIHPEFMKTQLAGSLKNLEQSKIDTYLIQNPEHFIMGLIRPDEVAGSEKIQQCRDLLNEALFNVFCALESEVKSGRIGSYGISSNSFALPEDHPHFVPFDVLPSIAQRAANHAQNEKPSFSTVQLPGNVLERTGLSPKSASGNGCAQFCSDHGYKVIVNRALTAFDDTGSWRLADAPFPVEYSSVRDALIDHLSPLPIDVSELTEEEKDEWDETLAACIWLRTLVSDLDAQVTFFTSVMHYQDDLHRTIIPMINSKLDGMDEESAKMLHRFFSVYEKAVRSVSAQQTRGHIFENLSKDTSLQHQHDRFVAPTAPLSLGSNDTLQEYALSWLENQPCVDTILLGCTKPEYTVEAARVVLKTK